MSQLYFDMMKWSIAPSFISLLVTRQAYGAALGKLAAANPRVIALDGDMKNSTFSQEMLKVYSDLLLVNSVNTLL